MRLHNNRRAHSRDSRKLEQRPCTSARGKVPDSSQPPAYGCGTQGATWQRAHTLQRVWIEKSASLPSQAKKRPFSEGDWLGGLPVGWRGQRCASGIALLGKQSRCIALTLGDTLDLERNGID